MVVGHRTCPAIGGLVSVHDRATLAYGDCLHESEVVMNEHKWRAISRVAIAYKDRPITGLFIVATMAAPWPLVLVLLTKWT